LVKVILVNDNTAELYLSRRWLSGSAWPFG